MSTSAANLPFLARGEGVAHVTALEAIAKGAVESELPIAALAGPRRPPFEGLARLALDEPSQRVLQRHGMEIAVAADTVRALAIAHRQARGNRAGVALVPNDALPAVLPGLQSIVLAGRSAEAPLVLVLEDHPEAMPALCPRRAVAGLAMPTIEPGTLDELRDAVEQAARLAKSGSCPVAIVAHAALLRSTDSLEGRPNRVVESTDTASLLRRMRRGPRSGETTDLLRMARRLELNRLVSLPSPGEREPLGLICVGPAFAAASYLLQELRLSGRVPMLRLGMTRPIDEAAVLRILLRSGRVLLLEPRPGSVAPDILAVAESARRRSTEPVAEVWCGEIPPPAEADAQPRTEPIELEANDATRPSILARKLIHVLHPLRPALQVASRLAVTPAELERMPCPPRGERMGAGAAAVAAREALLDADATVRAAPLSESGAAARTTALAIDGVPPPGEWDRIVLAEVWERRRFALEGIGAVRQAAREGRPRIVIIPDVGGDDDLDLSRLASAAVPADAAARMVIRAVDLNDRVALRDALRVAATNDLVNVLIAADGPPARRDVALVERSLAEVDRLGFLPTMRLVWPADVACEIRPPTMEWLIERGLERGTEELEDSWTVEQLSGTRRVLRIEARPMLEQVEIVRTRPPAPVVRGSLSERLPPPRPVHGQQPLWRAHVAGFRGEQPGLLAMALAEAGRQMGYRVQTVHLDTPIGPGRRGWAQVLFSRGHEDHSRPDASTAALLSLLPVEIAYGEADLLLAVDGVEGLRAIGPDTGLRVAAPDRTSTVANTGPLEDQFDETSLESCRRLAAALPLVTRPDQALIADLALACRARFLTDRVLDIVVLGAAFQRGLVPVTVEAIEVAVRRLEARGYGRCADAFDYGRRLATNQRLVDLAQSDEEEARDASGMRLLRRLLLETRSSGWRGRRRSQQFASLAREALAALPGLEASEEGHAARRDFLVGTHRCLTWGGMPLARRYADMVRAIHAADSAATGHELTRLVIRPLAEAMLIRDLFHMAAMSTSLEHRRRTRERLAVRLARGDVVERRYLNRVEVTAFGRRYRLDVRTSDWPARLLALVAPFVPGRFRGKGGEQELRDYVVGLVERAIRGASDNPKLWTTQLTRLADACSATSGFRGISAGELRLRVEGFAVE